MRRLLPFLVAALLLLTACGGGGAGSDDSKASDNPSADGSPNGSLKPQEDDPELAKAITVGGDKEPTLEVEKGYTTDDLATTVVKEGDGDPTPDKSTVLIDFIGVNAKDDKVFQSSFGQGQGLTLPLDQNQVNPLLVNVLANRHVGDQVAAAFPAEQLFGPQGNAQAGIDAKDTVVMLFEIHKVSDPEPLDTLSGGADKLPGDMPKLELNKKGVPTGFDGWKQAGKAPKKLVTQTLIQGDGPEVGVGDLVTFDYLGQVYDGKVFDQSYERGTPAVFQIGVGGLIQAWDESLIGVKKGSRLVIEVPPEQGYGKQGSPPQIPPNSPLVFVVDVLGVSK